MSVSVSVSELCQKKTGSLVCLVCLLVVSGRGSLSELRLKTGSVKAAAGSCLGERK